MKFVSLVALWALSAGSLFAQLSGVPYPITNGIMTTDLNANNFKINNLNLAGSGFMPSTTFSMSLVNTSNNVTLVNDVASPAANQVYGTNGSAVKGWYTPSVTGITSITSTGLPPIFTVSYSAGPAVTATFSLTNTAGGHLFLGNNTGAAGAPAYVALHEADLVLANNTTNNVSTAAHGFTPILPNNASVWLNGTGAWTAPAGAGTVTTTGSPGSGNLTAFSGATSITNTNLAGDVTTSNSSTTTIAANAVTYSKFQQVAATSLVGNTAGGAANAGNIGIAGGLSFVGGKLAPYSGSTAVTITAGAGTVDASTGKSFYFQLTTASGGNATLTFSNFNDGDSIAIRVQQAASGGPYTVTFPTATWQGGPQPTQTTTASKNDWYEFTSSGGTIFASARQNF